MDFQKPSNAGFTIYSKSGCPNCILAKKLVKTQNFTFDVVDCDDYLIEDKEKFLLFMHHLAEKEITRFPMIFYEGNFLGDYNEMTRFIDMLISFDDL